MRLIMSISGIRGWVGDGLTPEIAARFGAAFGSQLSGGSIVVGRDSRPSGEIFIAAVRSGLLAVGCRVIDLGITATPTVAMMISQRQASGGVVITASHNPIEWNGIKFLTRQGFAPPPEQAEAILSSYRSGQFAYVSVDRIGRTENDATATDAHVERVLSVLDVGAIRKRPIKVVLDSVNGAGGEGGRKLLERLGCRVEHVNAEPNGRFAHTPEPTAENLVSLCEEVRRREADLGFAQDPDADRLAVVDEGGRYIGEEYTLALCAKFLLSERRGPLAANLSSSRMIDDLAAVAGARVFRTAVGEAHVAQAVIENGCILGGEGNGGVIDPRVVCVRDSFTGMGLILNLLAKDGRPLSSIVDEIPRYVMIKRKYDAEPAQIAAWIGRTRESVTDGRILATDGIRIDWPDGWVHLRGSNTEPIARIISEARDEGTAKKLVERIERLR